MQFCILCMAAFASVNCNLLFSVPMLFLLYENKDIGMKILMKTLFTKMFWAIFYEVSATTYAISMALLFLLTICIYILTKLWLFFVTVFCQYGSYTIVYIAAFTKQRYNQSENLSDVETAPYRPQLQFSGLDSWVYFSGWTGMYYLSLENIIFSSFLTNSQFIDTDCHLHQRICLFIHY